MIKSSLSLMFSVCLFTVTAVNASDFTQISQVQDSYPQLSPDGSRIVFQSNRSGSRQIWIMNADGSDPQQITRVEGQGTETPTWSPDGTRIAFAQYVGEGNNDVFVMNADGSGATQLTFGGGYDGHPHWSADGERIVFNSDRDTPDPDAEWHLRWHDIWSINADGSDVTKHTDCRTTCTYASFSPNGKKLLYRKVDDRSGLNWLLDAGQRNSEIYIANLDGSDEQLVASHPAFDGWPMWSPDGEWIVFASNRTGPPLFAQLWLVRPDGSDLQQLTNDEWGHAQPSWTATDNNILAYRFLERMDSEVGGIVLIKTDL